MRDLPILCIAYAISLFYRGMISVIAPEIVVDLALDERRLGVLSSIFFISFAVAQIPSGLMLDRFGARLCIGGFMWLAVLGSALFAFADSYLMALSGQALIGFGCAPIFTGSMLFIGRHYPPQRFAYITALVIAIGSIGDLLGTTPLALLAEWLGWRTALLVAMGIAALAASGCLLGLSPDRPDGDKQPLTFMLLGMARVMTVPGLWPIIPMFLTSYAVLMAIRGLWSGPYLADVFSLDTSERGHIILAMSLAMAIGTFVLGTVDRLLQSTKRLVIASALLTLIPLLLLAVGPGQGPFAAMWAFIAIGLFGFNYPLLMSHCRTFLAPAYHGRGMAFLTAVSFVGVALVQAGSGWMIDAIVELPVTAAERYRLLFIALALILVAATLSYARSRPQGNADQPVKAKSALAPPSSPPSSPS